MPSDPVGEGESPADDDHGRQVPQHRQHVDWDRAIQIALMALAAIQTFTLLLK